MALLHVAGAAGLTASSLFYLAPWTGVAVLPALITLFVSVPLACTGLLVFYFGSYREVPAITWVIVCMLLGAGLLLLGSMFLV